MTTTTLMSSSTMSSAFSSCSDSSPSPAHNSIAFETILRTSPTADGESLAPPPSPYPATVDPSPVESNGSHSTDVTDIDQDDLRSPQTSLIVNSPSDVAIISPVSGRSADDIAPLPLIDTNVESVGPEDGQPQSVIHVPLNFRKFDCNRRSPQHQHRRSGSSPSTTSENTAVVSPTSPGQAGMQQNEEIAKPSDNSIGPPIDTHVLPTPRGAGATPRASTVQEAEVETGRRSWASSKNLADIQEHEDPTRSDSLTANDGDVGGDVQNATKADEDVTRLQTALTECWTLCNTLANLSSSHRERMFSLADSGNVQEQAWKSCWTLCQNLYESRNEDHASQVRPTMELCRNFCQALFEARQRGDEVTDSILRVSFELNNHLYNTHDRNLPDAFRERTLDFYLTMCHRLMKQRTSLPEETDSLLRACWSLAELLFSLRQNNRSNRAVDEELLGSTVQACWDLCDLFREGWSQIRPERTTPRPTKTTFGIDRFPTAATQSSSSRPESSQSGTFHSVKSFPPETPTTIYDDREDISPTEEMAVPNIMVLGPGPPAQQRWSSNSSVTSSSLSGYSESSRRTTARPISRTATPLPTRGVASAPAPSQAQAQLQPQTHPQTQSHLSQPQVHPSQIQTQAPADSSHEDPNLLRLKALVLKAAQNLGFPSTSTASSTTLLSQSLPAFVASLPQTAFGSQHWQLSLFDAYRKLVTSDPSLRGNSRTILAGAGPAAAGGRIGLPEVARAVLWMKGRNDAFAWMTDLFTLVFGFEVEEAGGRGGGLVV